MDPSDTIDDKYGLGGASSDDIKRKMAQDDSDEETESNTFLKVYDKDKDAKTADDENTKLEEIKTTHETEDTENHEKSSPMIQELKSETFETQSSESGAAKPVASPLVPVFSWETAERVDAKYTFMNQGDLVFINCNFKGYNKEADARYALSDNEILLEVRDVSKNKVHRICKTLMHPIDCKESQV